MNLARWRHLGPGLALALALLGGCSASLAAVTAEAIGCPIDQVQVGERVNAQWNARCGARPYLCTQTEESVGGAHRTDADYRTNPQFRCDPTGP